MKMKVIAKVNERVFLCEIEEDEIQRFLNIYYTNNNKLSVGKEFDLSKSYELNDQIKEGVRRMDELISDCDKITKAIKEARIIKKKIDKN